MSYRLVSCAPNQFQLVLEKEPPFISALPMAPLQPEPEIMHGNWLLLVFAVWSIADTRAIQTAIDVVKRRNGKLNLGIRPFHRHDELNLWMRDTHLPTHDSKNISERSRGAIRELFISSDRSRNPLWLILQDGKLIRECSGPLTEELLEEFLQNQMLPKLR